MPDVIESTTVPTVSTLAVVREELEFVLFGVPDRPDTPALILGPLVEAKIDVDAMALNTQDDGTANFSFIIHRDDYQPVLAILEQLVPGLGNVRIQAQPAIAKLSMRGSRLWQQPGILDAVLIALAAQDIRIQSISTSEQTLSVLIDDIDVESAVQALQQAFPQLELVLARV